MKITAIETRAVRLPLDPPIGSALGQISGFGCVLVRARIADGPVGENLVFTLNDHRTKLLQRMVDELADQAIGQDAQQIAAFWARAWRDNNFIGQKGLPVMGISAIDGALWDALGKSANLPLWRLLGGARQHVPAYHSGGLWLTRDLPALVAEAESFAAQGFRAMKMRLGLGLRQDLERVAAVRKAIGPDIKLMADANQGMTENDAIRLGRGLEEFNLTWFEEPLPAWDIEGLARVAAALDTPIASGETDYTRYGFRQMITQRAADVLMPDLQRVGGVTEFMRVGHLADAHDLPVSSHLFPETSLSVLAALGNATFLEYMPWFAGLYNEKLEFSEGRAIAPERPGWGFTFNEDFIARFAR